MKKRILVDRKLYSKESVFQTCFTFIDDFYFMLDSTDSRIVVNIEPKKKCSDKSLEESVKKFHNELLLQETRFKISRDNRKVREAIINQALFSSMPLQQQQCAAPEQQSAAQSEEDRLIDLEVERIIKEAEKSNIDDDILGIMMPWEEKYAGKGKKAGKAGAKKSVAGKKERR